jgi:hypothetical protein
VIEKAHSVLPLKNLQILDCDSGASATRSDKEEKFFASFPDVM